MVLKYPNCPVCKALREAFSKKDVSDEMINDYHESKIGWEDFPRYLQDDVLQIVIETENSTKTHKEKKNEEEIETISEHRLKHSYWRKPIIEDDGSIWCAICGARLKKG